MPIKKNLYKRVIKEYALKCLALIVIQLSFSQMSIAQEMTKIKNIVDELKKSKEATVVLYVPMQESERERYEERQTALIRSVGCNFVSDNKSKIESLLITLNNNLKAHKEHDFYIPYFGISLYFTSSDGQESQLFIGRRYMNEATVDGELILKGSYLANIYVLANKDIYRDIYNWLSDGVEIKHGPDSKYYKHLPYSNTEERQFIKSCKNIAHGNYYRNHAKQTCAIPENQRELSDVCPVGWEPAI